MTNDTPAQPQVPLDELKRRILAMEDVLVTDFWSGTPVAELVSRRARFIDAFLSELWDRFFGNDARYALLAVGGYGRRELHPSSDIDLLLLVKSRSLKDERLETFVRLLWDLRLDIGHSVRTIRECKQQAAADLTVITALGERRLIAGSASLAEDLNRALSSRFIWPSRRYFQGKFDEQRERHEFYSDVEYGLEPNVKSSPGGLRDIQMISWVSKRHFGASDLADLTELELLTNDEVTTLIDGRNFLWRVRFALHVVAGRKEDQLLFDHQREIAKRFGYEDTDGMLAVELFMRDYYRKVLELREVNDILLQHFEETILYPSKRRRIRSINDRFQVHNDYIEVTSKDVFEQNRSAMMEIFVIMANNAKIKGVRANTIRLIRDSLHLIDEEFRNDPEISRLFLALLQSPFTVVSHLTRLRRYGILGRYIPQFGRIIGQMQHDLFHIYTVDAHTMMLIRHLRRMAMPEYVEKFPLASSVMEDIEKIELLFIAALFHDIGKGRGGNHSELGAEDAIQFCKQLNLSEEDGATVAWLVQQHLVMSMTAQREDISDPEIVREFANTVHTISRLRYLYLLTTADIQATNPELWNAWRASLLSQLYNATFALLERGTGQSAADLSEVERRRADTARLIVERKLEGVDLDELWTATDDGFVLHHSAEVLADIAQVFSQREGTTTEVLLLESASEQAEGGIVEIFIYTQDRPSLFADCVCALDELDLAVMDAYLTTGADNACFDSFIVMTANRQPLPVDERARVTNYLHDVVTGERTATGHHDRRISRQLKQFQRRAQVTISAPDDSGFAELTLTAADRPGLLATVGKLFVELDVQIHQARITTLGERVEDRFRVTHVTPTGFEDQAIVDRIKHELATRVDATLVATAA